MIILGVVYGNCITSLNTSSSSLYHISLILNFLTTHSSKVGQTELWIVLQMLCAFTYCSSQNSSYKQNQKLWSYIYEKMYYKELTHAIMVTGKSQDMEGGVDYLVLVQIWRPENHKIWWYRLSLMADLRPRKSLCFSLNPKLMSQFKGHQTGRITESKVSLLGLLRPLTDWIRPTYIVQAICFTWSTHTNANLF